MLVGRPIGPDRRRSSPLAGRRLLRDHQRERRDLFQIRKFVCLSAPPTLRILVKDVQELMEPIVEIRHVELRSLDPSMRERNVPGAAKFGGQ